ncbi:MAG: hypothetical protein IJ617_08565 [Oscillospiraceae bacterium]|nr:hypothetical protein [Oscillospiraceae bacterium]
MRFHPLLRLRRTKIYEPGRAKRAYKSLPKGLDWKQLEDSPRPPARDVLRGVGRHVVLVDSPDPRVFEQAIFIIREDYLMKRKDGGKSEILREAETVADAYIRSALLVPRRRRPRIPPALFAAAGAVLAGGVLLALHLLHIL